jgi:hypothetical protein
MRPLPLTCINVTTALAVIALSGCKGAEPAPAAQHAEEAAADVAGPPNINVKSAPGVAFKYDYAFVLPDKVISATQEAHAQACEKLGPSQCRITGMRYTLQDQDRVSAELDFKLAPELARNFGKEGIAAVERAEGKLINAAITGDDVGTEISDSTRRSADGKARLTQIEERLKGKLGDNERAELQSEAQQLHQQLADETQTRATGQAQLASTPVTFTYEGGAGFSLGGHPFADAGNVAKGSLTTMIALVLTGIGAVLPWLLLLLAMLPIWRSRPVVWLRKYVRGKTVEVPGS